MAGAKTTVLVIDDNEYVRRAFERILHLAGFSVALAEDGAAGLAAVRATMPDAILLDLSMPGLSGLEVLTDLAAESPEMPIIVVSGTGDVGDVVQALRRGAWDYVTKPVEDAHMLVQAVRRGLEKASLLRENREQRTHLEQANRKLTETLDELRSDQEAGRRTQFQLLPADGLCIGDYEFRRRLFASQYLSGDFVDYFVVDPRHAAMYLADVSGHGSASAFVTAMLAALIGRYREAMNRGESDVILRPDQLLETLNRDLLSQKLGKHVTMFYGVLDLASHRLSFSNGGHFPYPLLDDGQEVRMLECSGRPLGLFADAHFSRREVALSTSRRALLASDGVLELLPEGAGTKIDQLMAAFHRAPDLDALVAGLGMEDPSKRLRDDVTLLWMQRKADA